LFNFSIFFPLSFGVHSYLVFEYSILSNQMQTIPSVGQFGPPFGNNQFHWVPSGQKYPGDGFLQGNCIPIFDSRFFPLNSFTQLGMGNSWVGGQFPQPVPLDLSRVPVFNFPMGLGEGGRVDNSTTLKQNEGVFLGAPLFKSGGDSSLGIGGIQPSGVTNNVVGGMGVDHLRNLGLHPNIQCVRGVIPPNPIANRTPIFNSNIQGVHVVNPQIPSQNSFKNNVNNNDDNKGAKPKRTFAQVTAASNPIPTSNRQGLDGINVMRNTVRVPDRTRSFQTRPSNFMVTNLLYRLAQGRHHLENWKHIPKSVSVMTRNIFENINPPARDEGLTRKFNLLNDSLQQDILLTVRNHLERQIEQISRELSLLDRGLFSVEDLNKQKLTAVELVTKRLPRTARFGNTVRRWIEEGSSLLGSKVGSSLLGSKVVSGQTVSGGSAATGGSTASGGSADTGVVLENGKEQRLSGHNLGRNQRDASFRFSSDVIAEVVEVGLGIEKDSRIGDTCKDKGLSSVRSNISSPTLRSLIDTKLQNRFLPLADLEEVEGGVRDRLSVLAPSVIVDPPECSGYSSSLGKGSKTNQNKQINKFNSKQIPPPYLSLRSRRLASSVEDKDFLDLSAEQGFEGRGDGLQVLPNSVINHSGADKDTWKVEVRDGTETLILSDSLLRPVIQIPDKVELHIFSGATLSHATKLLTTLKVSDNLKNIVISMGINNREDSIDAGPRVELNNLTKIKLGNVKLFFLGISIPSLLKESESTNLTDINFVASLSCFKNSLYIPPLPTSQVQTRSSYDFHYDNETVEVVFNLIMTHLRGLKAM
jgi:hypothetical protein